MRLIKQTVISSIILLSISACAWWQTDPTPSTLNNAVYSQSALNVILHSASGALTDKVIANGADSNNNYTVVYALFLKGKPTAISIISTPGGNTYFVNMIKSQDISATLFAPNTKIIHSDTDIVNISYNKIQNQAAKEYLNTLGYTSRHNFLRRTTYFYNNNETLTLTDYILPDKETNKFDY